MTRPIAWRDTARIPKLFGLDARILVILVLPVLSPVGKLPLLLACSVVGVGLGVAGLWFDLTPDAAIRRLRARFAGRCTAVLPEHRPVKTLWTGEQDQ